MNISKETIEALKTNLAQLDRMPDSQRDAILKIGIRHVKSLMTNGEWATLPSDCKFEGSSIYRLRADYEHKEEPEVFSCDVELFNGDGFDSYLFEYPNVVTPFCLNEAIGLVGFIGTEYAGTDTVYRPYRFMVGLSDGKIETADPLVPIRVWFRRVAQ